MNNCAFCGKECKNANSHRNHERLCPQNLNRVYVNGMKGKSAWNRGMTKGDDERLSRSEETRIRISKKAKLQNHSNERRQKLRDHAIRRKLGGVRQSKWIRYRDSILGSTYELQVAQSLDDNLINWEIPKRFCYTDMNGRERTYTPDFYLPDYNIYLDPKNDFLINQTNPGLGFRDIEKIRWVSEQNDITILVLDKDHLTWEQIKNILPLKHKRRCTGFVILRTQFDSERRLHFS